MASPDSIIGRTLGHYRILEQIGAGGMGVVYRAHDERLQRDVALKVLLPGTLADDSARKRFRQEALALSRLNHPNIATVHDFDTQEGIDFLVTELIPGMTLDEKLVAGLLPEKEVIQIGLQIADGLETAHQQGVIHRDVKPGNLRLTPEGQLKILDFGLAKRMDPVGPATVTESFSAQRGPAGTLPYMAPEQLREEKLDARTDIWAAGVVLYEMATGRRPFEAKTSMSLADQILHAPVPALSGMQPRLSSRLRDVILKCLDKDAENRYQSAKELQVDLRRLASPTSSASAASAATRKRTRPKRIRSLAVLPLANFSHDPEQEYFADGMTEALICDLAKIRALKITSRTSVMRYKGTEKPLREIAEELNVDALVEGSVTRAGQRVRITAQLIHAASDTHLWAENYERALEDVLLVQSEIARAIALEINLVLTPEEARRLSAARRVNASAYDAYLKGRFYWYKLSREHLNTALQYFQLVLEKDPSSSLAYAGLSGVWGALGDCGIVPPREAVPKAKAAALKAIELDDSLAEAHINLANLRCLEWNWDDAEKEYRRAIELTPNSAEAHFFYSDLLISRRRTEEWRREVDHALELDPLNFFFQCFFGWHLLYLHRCDEAIAALRKSLRTEPNYAAAHLRLWGALYQKRMYDEAVAEAKTFFEVLGDTETAGTLQLGYAQRGYTGAMRLAAETLAARSQLTYVPPTQVARLYAHAADKDQALQWLEKAYEERLPAMVHLGVDLDWDLLRDDPRFQDLLRRLNS